MFLLKKIFSALAILVFFTSCSTLQRQEAASRDVKKIRNDLKAARKDIRSIQPGILTEVEKINKKSEKALLITTDKLSYIEKEILKLKVNQANQLRDTGGVTESLQEIISKLEEYNHRVSTTTRRLESIDSRISQLSDVYRAVAEREEGYASEAELSRKRESMRWANMGNSILAIQADLAELKTHIDSLRPGKGSKKRPAKKKSPPFKATLKPSKTEMPRPQPSGRRKAEIKKPLSRIVNITPGELYNTAYKDYLKGNFDLAISEFKEFLTKFPDKEASVNARYWMGESYYAKKSYSDAIEAFTGLQKKYPENIKIPSAMLKISYCHINLNQTGKAEEILKRLISDFPSSGEAELAKDTLATLKR